MESRNRILNAVTEKTFATIEDITTEKQESKSYNLYL
jgi:hypothetical protein